MRSCHYTITRQTVHDYAEWLCQRHIRLRDQLAADQLQKKEKRA